MQEKAVYDQPSRDLFCLPPDLFVKELTRSCIEQIIVALLEQGEGNLEQVLNPRTLSLHWMAPWQDLYENVEQAQLFEEELAKKINAQHPLAELYYVVVAYHQETHQVVLDLYDVGYAEVNLSSEEQANAAHHPNTTFYANTQDFWNKRMYQEITEYQTKKP